MRYRSWRSPGEGVPGPVEVLAVRVGVDRLRAAPVGVPERGGVAVGAVAHQGHDAAGARPPRAARTPAAGRRRGWCRSTGPRAARTGRRGRASSRPTPHRARRASGRRPGARTTARPAAVRCLRCATRACPPTSCRVGGQERRALRIDDGEPGGEAAVAQVPADRRARAAGARADHDPLGHRVRLGGQLLEDRLGDVVVAAPVGGALGVGELVEVVAAQLVGQASRDVVDGAGGCPPARTGRPRARSGRACRGSSSGRPPPRTAARAAGRSRPR